MNRFLSRFFIVLAILSAAFALSFAYYLDRLEAGSGFHSRIVWLMLGGFLFLAVAAWRFPLKAKFLIFALILTFVSVELLLQTAGWLGVLPGVNTKLRVPFGRIYWSSEGHSNSIRNRFGWNYPAFDLQAAHRIAFIGDSQVEALEVPCTRNQAACLQGLLRKKGPDWAVLGLGSHGTCPAHSIEVLEYAARHLKPQEVFLFISIGSDIIEASPLLNGYPPDRFLYYDLASDGSLVLNPASAQVRDLFNRTLELHHSSVLGSLPMILISHCMTLQVAMSFRDSLALRKRQAEFARQASKLQRKEGEEYQRLGFNPAPFAVDPEPEARRAMAVLLAQIQHCNDLCKTQRATMRLVTLPSFPKAFYDSQSGTNWTMHLGSYDYLAPERALVAFAATNQIPVLALGDAIRSKNFSVEEIRSLYFSDGVGHLTEKGHRFCAEAIYNAFYR